MAKEIPVEIQSLVGSYLELIPGTAASQRNLRTLLDHVLNVGYHKCCDDLAVEVNRKKRRGLMKLEARVEGPKIPRSCLRLFLCCQEFPASEDGLLEAVVFLKTVVRKYRTEGVCESCRGNHYMRLKADGMPTCEQCMLTAAIGLS